jgi:DNA-binding response OmpR family regulator
MNHVRHPGVLVVDDEALLAMQTEMLLADGGFRVIGPAATVAEAIRLAETESPDVAILDVNLAGEKVFPVADLLTAVKIPFLFLSGHSRNILPAAYRNSVFLEKPLDPDSLLQNVNRLLRSARPQSDRNRTRELQHLREADAHIAHGRNRLARQSAVVSRLTAKGQDATVAKSLFETMGATLAAMEGHRQLILKELARIQA